MPVSGISLNPPPGNNRKIPVAPVLLLQAKQEPIPEFKMTFNNWKGLAGFFAVYKLRQPAYFGETETFASRFKKLPLQHLNPVFSPQYGEEFQIARPGVNERGIRLQRKGYDATQTGNRTNVRRLERTGDIPGNGGKPVFTDVVVKNDHNVIDLRGNTIKVDEIVTRAEHPKLKQVPEIIRQARKDAVYEKLEFFFKDNEIQTRPEIEIKFSGIAQNRESAVLKNAGSVEKLILKLRDPVLGPDKSATSQLLAKGIELPWQGERLHLPPIEMDNKRIMRIDKVAKRIKLYIGFLSALGAVAVGYTAGKAIYDDTVELNANPQKVGARFGIGLGEQSLRMATSFAGAAIGGAIGAALGGFAGAAFSPLPLPTVGRVNVSLGVAVAGAQFVGNYGGDIGDIFGKYIWNTWLEPNRQKVSMRKSNFTQRHAAQI